MSTKIFRRIAGGFVLILIIYLKDLQKAKAASDLLLGAVFDMNQADGSVNVKAAADISAHLMAIDDANLKYKNLSITIKSAIRNSKTKFSDSAVAGEIHPHN